MNLPIDTETTPITARPPVAPDIDDLGETLLPPFDLVTYAQIAARRSQLENAETLRLARAM